MIREWIEQILLKILMAEKYRTIKLEWEKAKLQQAVERAKRNK